jgi:DNA-binding transcriptional ArsR family regulator
MRVKPPPLLAIFRSQVQGELLAQVLLSDRPVTIADLSRQLRAPLPTVAREVNRLKDAGILTVVRHGRGQLVSGNETNPAYRPLRDLVAVVFGPRFVVAEEFASLAGLQELLIFGSWAARFRGEQGPVPGDVDVLTVGALDRDDVYDAAERATRRLAREVNATVVSANRWNAPDGEADPFIRQVRGRPQVRLFPPDQEPAAPIMGPTSGDAVNAETKEA